MVLDPLQVDVGQGVLATGFAVLVTLDLFAIGIGIVNARNVGTDEAAREAAAAAHARLDQLLGLDRRDSLDDHLDAHANGDPNDFMRDGGEHP